MRADSTGRGDGDGRADALRRDIARINARLRDGLSVALARSDAVGRAGVEGLVLFVELPDGGRRSAWRPLGLGRRGRRRRLALAACIAECAMSVGLGAGIYRPGKT